MGVVVARWQRLVVLAAALVILIVGGILAYDAYADWRAKRTAQEAALTEAKKAVAEQSAGTEYFLKSTFSDSDMTYAQLFDRADERAKKITDAIVAVQSSDLPDDQKKAAVAYLNALNDTLDALVMEYRKSLNSSNALDSVKSARSDYLSTPYNEYSDTWERKRVSDAAEEARKALDDFKDATGSFNRKLKALLKAKKEADSTLQDFKLIDESVLTKAIAKSDEDLKKMS